MWMQCSFKEETKREGGCDSERGTVKNERQEEQRSRVGDAILAVPFCSWFGLVVCKIVTAEWANLINIYVHRGRAMNIYIYIYIYYAPQAIIYNIYGSKFSLETKAVVQIYD